MNRSIFTLFFIVLLLSLSAHALVGGRMLRERDPQGPSRSIVLLELKNNGKPVSHCTGALIRKNVIITAGHCFDRGFVSPYTEFDIIFDQYQDGSSFRTVIAGSHVVIHPDYTPAEPKKPKILQNDIALVFFSGELPPGLEPVPFDTEVNADYSRAEVQVFGYGRSIDYTGKPGEDVTFSSGVLRYGNMKVAASNYFDSAYHYVVEANPEIPAYICQGDSGGPQFLKTEQGFKIIGINSGGGVAKSDGSGMLTCISTGTSAKVASAARWIQEQIQNH